MEVQGTIDSNGTEQRAADRFIQTVPPSPRPQHRALPQAANAIENSSEMNIRPSVESPEDDEEIVTRDRSIRVPACLPPCPPRRTRRVDEEVIEKQDADWESQWPIRVASPMSSLVWRNRLLVRNRDRSFDGYQREKALRPFTMNRYFRKNSSMTLPPVPTFNRTSSN